MPLYEYQCEKCGLVHEVIQKFSDSPLQECPECTGPLQKLLSASAIQFKGSGWYVTDYGKNGKKKEKGDDPNTTDAKTPGNKKDTEKKSNTKSDSASSKKPKSTKTATTSS